MTYQDRLAQCRDKDDLEKLELICNCGNEMTVACEFCGTLFDCEDCAISDICGHCESVLDD